MVGLRSSGSPALELYCLTSNRILPFSRPYLQQISHGPHFVLDSNVAFVDNGGMKNKPRYPNSTTMAGKRQTLRDGLALAWIRFKHPEMYEKFQAIACKKYPIPTGLRRRASQDYMAMLEKEL